MVMEALASRETNSTDLASDEAPAGFKGTEIGVIPDDWGAKSLNQLCDMKSGDSITSKNINDGARYPCYGGNGLRGYTSNFTHDGVFTLIGRQGALCGNVVEGSGKFFASEHAIVATAKPGIAQHWLTYVLHRLNLNRLSESSAQPGLSVSKILSVVVAAPLTKAEQQAIAEALSDADALIEGLEKLIAKKRLSKQGAMQELLTGRRRLLGFENKPGYKQTEVGVIPEGWDVKHLGDLFEITSSKRVFQSEWKTGGVPFYRARELAILGESRTVDNDLFISREMYEQFKRQYGVPASGDMLVTGVGTLGKTYVIADNHEFYFKDGNIIWFKIGTSISSEFLRQLFLTPAVIKQIGDGSAGTTVGTYTITGAKKTVVPFPPLPEQQAIANTLSDMDSEIATLEEKLTKARQIKQGMMQELLTGRIRLI